MTDNSSDNLAVIILAAGQGKRMLDPSKAKVMYPLAGKPLIQHVLETAEQLSKNIYIIVGYQKESVIDFVNSFGKDFNIVEQKEQLGTGHAVAQTESLLRNFTGDILILCGDVPNLSYKTLLQFIENHQTESADISVLSTIADNPYGYGRIIRNEKLEFLKITEEKDASPEEKDVSEINSGVYLVKSNLLFPALHKVSNRNAQGEYYLTDIIEILRNENAKVYAFPDADFGETSGVNSPDDLKNAESYFFKNHE
ncbi:UDP-N-acetylglucosamine pyrophosphorylase [Bacteroidetes/Chlorobi group bacterium ChocPot_Mid]|jgi:UDP-N-acetylglucosamine diphosphorylase/glucosamine-1-phosphate N-acetyltransferase|nr:MAG: UDP-N-acetylglucosamine pyrophosphorylase [Bacteroidetes/Chlorobi group bacterium ChocPot_Mid]